MACRVKACMHKYVSELWYWLFCLQNRSILFVLYWNLQLIFDMNECWHSVLLVWQKQCYYRKICMIVVVFEVEEVCRVGKYVGPSSFGKITNFTNHSQDDRRWGLWNDVLTLSCSVTNITDMNEMTEVARISCKMISTKNRCP